VDLNPTGYGFYSDNAYLRGSLLCGGGNVLLDSDGISLIAGSGDANSVKWYDSGVIVGKMLCYKSAGNFYIWIQNDSVPAADKTMQIYLQAYDNGMAPTDIIITSKTSTQSGGISMRISTALKMGLDNSGVGFYDETAWWKTGVKKASIDEDGYVGSVQYWGAVGNFLALPGLRGFWPMSAFDSAGGAQDVSGHGHHLTYNGNPTYNYSNLVPYIDLDGTGDSLSRADEADLDITGTESYVAASVRGLTFGGWFWIDSFTPVVNALMMKWPAGGNLSYALFEAGGLYYFIITGDGTTQVTVTSATATTGAWHFIIGRFIPSTELNLFDNGVKSTNVAGIPASVYSGNGALYIGWDQADNSYLDGRAALCFLCATWLSDAAIAALYQQTRMLFGV